MTIKRGKKRTRSRRNNIAHAAIRKAAKQHKDNRSLWRLEDGITFSSLAKFNECPEQFSLSYIDGLSSKKISEPLEFGSVFHLALEHQDRGTPTEVIQHVGNQYRNWRRQTVTNSADKDKLDKILGLACITFPQYCEYWKNDDKQIEWVSREEKFDVPYEVPFPDGSHRAIRLRGMRDGIYRAKGILGLFETKTKGVISEDQILQGLQSDMQTMLYIVATYLETGNPPLQVKYNVIRRTGLKVRKNDSLNDWLTRVEEDMLSRPDHYFKRYNVTITKQDIGNFINNTLNPELRLFLQWYDSVKKDPTLHGRRKSPFHHLNCSNLIGKYGKTDMFEAVFGRMGGYHRRKEVFPELDGSFQVTWKK